MGRERQDVAAEAGGEEAEFAAYLYSIYRSGLGGELDFDAFKVQQLTVDLITEFACADRDNRRGLIADVLNLLSREDFEASDEDC